MKLDTDFRALMPKLTKDEYDRLEQSIIDEGCRDALIAWQEDDILIDGYNRYDICKKHDIDFQITLMSFGSRSKVEDWIIDNQLGRRNLTVEQKNYLIGKKYKKEKQQHGGDRKSKAQNELLISTAERIAEEHKVGRETVKRAEKFVDAVDIIAGNVGEEARDEILSRNIDITAKGLQILANQEPEVQQQVIEKVRLGKSMKKAISESKKALVETPPLPEGKYNVIYADPPWDIGSIKLEKWESPLDDKYPTMTMEARIWDAKLCSTFQVYFAPSKR